MASNSTNRAFSSFIPTPNWKYEVFLSFRGEDTRKTFVDHLYHALNNNSIYTFKDDEELQSGDEISPTLVKAIEQSRFAFIVFSKHYASSKWCLDELVKILECKEKLGQTVIPIFYDVQPSEVRKQTGSFGTAFENHEKAFNGNMEKVQRWRKALEEAADISGVCVPDTANGHESKCIKQIIEENFSKLNHSYPTVANDLVGIESRVKEVESLLRLDLDGVRSIGLWGMGGIGKTTIVEAVFNRISHKFEGRCFLANVRESSASNGGLEALQERLLSELFNGSNINTTVGGLANVIKYRLCNRKVLIVVDDVDQVKQLEVLAGKHDWFGSGSRIIITTRDKQLLISHGVTEIYEAKALKFVEAIQLFSSKAFRKSSPHEDYVELSEDIVHYTGGLPLALTILGSFLCGRTVEQWESALSKLHKIPNKEILKVLQISYDGLDEMEKRIFLDVACFFKGKGKDFVTRILDSCGLHPDIGISVLIQRCLITIKSGDQFWMHDLVQEMGWYIVRQESEELGKRSRLWFPEDVCYVLAENMGTEKVEGMVLELSESRVVDLNSKAFRKMKKLRLLKFHNVVFRKGPAHLPNELRWLDWQAYPSDCLPASFQAKNLIELSMCYSSINQLWKKVKPLPELKALNLSHSHRLSRIPDFRVIPNLETLVLEDCTSLVEIHQSLGGLKRLVFLILRDCTNLKIFPSSIHLVSLKTFILSGCSKLEKFPEIMVKMECLSELHLDRTAIKELPSSIINLSSLTLIDLSECRNLRSLPEIICRLGCLKKLELSGCSKLEKFPEILVNMKSLSEVYLDRTAIRELPSSIEQIISLTLLDLSECKNLLSLPETICRLKCLKTLIVSGCSKLEELPEGLGNIKCLEELHANKTAIKRLPSSINLLKDLRVLSLSGCKGTIMSESFVSSRFLPRKHEDSLCLALPSLTGLYSLRELDLSDCNLSEGGIPSDLSSLSSLRKLNLRSNNFVSLPGSISQLSQLKTLVLVGCQMLEALPQLPSCISEIYADDCHSLTSVGDLSSESLTLAFFSNCFKLLENKVSEKVVDMLLINALKFALKITRSTLKTRCFDDYESSILLPGREIPKWFSHQYLGTKASLQLPPDWYNERFLGIAVCVVLDFVPVYKKFCIFVRFVDSNNESHGAACKFCEFAEGTNIDSQHIWLTFFKNHRIICHPGKSLKKCCELVVHGTQPLRKKKWGVRLVYEKDELNGTPYYPRHPPEIMAAYEVLDRITPRKRKIDEYDVNPPISNNSSDKVSWTLSPTGSFHLKSTYTALLPPSPLINWSHVIWFKYHIPRHSFVAWAAIHHKLKTKDKSGFSNRQFDRACSLCNLEDESHNHLFFNCPYSNRVWQVSQHKCGIYAGEQGIEAIANWIANLWCSTSKSPKALMYKLCFACCVYFLWKERNNRTFRNQRLTVEQLWNQIEDCVRSKLSTVLFSDCTSSRVVAAVWRLPSTVIASNP